MVIVNRLMWSWICPSVKLCCLSTNSWMSKRPWTHRQGEPPPSVPLLLHFDLKMNKVIQTLTVMDYLSAVTFKSLRFNQFAPVTVATMAEPTWLQKSGSQWLLISVSKTICCNRGGGWHKIATLHTHTHTHSIGPGLDCQQHSGLLMMLKIIISGSVCLCLISGKNTVQHVRACVCMCVQMVCLSLRSFQS